MKLTFLGTGTSIGVPAIGCQCEVCRSTDPHDKRLRTSALLETDGGLRVLIDCGADFRQQILTQRFGKFDGVMLTHIHYDHVGGMDDLRPFGMFGDVDVYADEHVVRGLHQTIPYCFKEQLYPGVPRLQLHTIEPHHPITISRTEAKTVKMPASGADRHGNLIKEGITVTTLPATDTLSVMPITVMHGKMPILGYIFQTIDAEGGKSKRLAYITDMKYIEDSELPYLTDIDTLVVNALRFEKEHHSHQLADDAIAFSRMIGARETYLIHVTHDIGFHDIANARLPHGFHIPYDGEIITL